MLVFIKRYITAINQLEIAFKTKKLREICEDCNKAEELLGEDVSRKLASRLSDLRACESIEQLPVGNPSEVVIGGKRTISINIAQKVHLYFSSNHVSQSKNNRVDWSKVYRIKIVQIEGLT